MIKFRALKADEIDCRIGSVAKDGSWVTLLLYKDARCDMNILDETVGAENWSREHYQVKNKDFCRVGINVNYKAPELEPRWVYKSDCGSEKSGSEKSGSEKSGSFTEVGKAEASDAFKRAGFCWGIGRELYTSPFIFIPIKRKLPNGQEQETYELDKNGKPKASFRVTFMGVKNGKITELNIENDKKRATVFYWKAKEDGE